MYFNDNKEIDQKFKKDIEIHFYYKWNNDKNLAFEGNVSVTEQLPNYVVRKVFTDFLYSEFLRKYDRFFAFKNITSL